MDEIKLLIHGKDYTSEVFSIYLVLNCSREILLS